MSPAGDGQSATILVADDDRSIRTVLHQAMARLGHQVQVTGNVTTLWDWVEQGAGDLLITDVMFPDGDALDMLPRIKKTRPDMPVIVMSARNSLQTAVRATERGAFEYLPKPFDLNEVARAVRRGLAGSAAKDIESAAEVDDGEFDERLPLIGRSSAMQEIYRTLARLMSTDLTVMIEGESGTGKELIARALHQYGKRRAAPFIAINMAAIPRELIESELFGHEKGAFTGAQNARQGRFEQADGGTLFLDEIGDMPLDVQTRLLRVLADGQFYRVGGHQSVTVDVRIIAATHQNLEKRVAEGKFREDLFHRLNVIRIHIPSLSERREDIPLLAAHFLRQAGKELNVETKGLSKEAEKVMTQLAWPGNVRQLENVCRWLTVMASGQEVLPSDLPPEIHSENTVEQDQVQSADWPQLLARWTDAQLRAGHFDILNDAMLTFEKVMLERALAFTHGHKQDAAKRLGWGRNTLTRKLKELDINH